MTWWLQHHAESLVATDPRAPVPAPSGAAGASAGRRSWPCEAARPVGPMLRRERAAVRFGHLSAERETDAAAVRFRGEERDEEFPRVRQARTVVADGDRAGAEATPRSRRDRPRCREPSRSRRAGIRSTGDKPRHPLGECPTAWTGPMSDHWTHRHKIPSDSALKTACPRRTFRPE